MSDAAVRFEDVTPGALFLWRAYLAPGTQIPVGAYRASGGQLLWEPLGIVKDGQRLALAVRVDNRQVKLMKVESRLKNARLEIRYVNMQLSASDPAGETGDLQSATIALAKMIECFASGNETVDAERA